VRDGPAITDLRTTEGERGAEVVKIAREFASMGLLVGIICSDSIRSSITREFAASGVRLFEARHDGIGGAMTLLSPIEAKGLEFDAVVVVEPAEIVNEEVGGRRLLFISLTRTTSRLAVVHVEPFLESKSLDL
jgi:hypothetical protein